MIYKKMADVSLLDPQWKHACCSYDPQEPGARDKARQDMLEFIAAQHPKGHRLVALEGEWLKEVVVEDIDYFNPKNVTLWEQPPKEGKMHVVIDCTYMFEPIASAA